MVPWLSSTTAAKFKALGKLLEVMELVRGIQRAAGNDAAW